MNKKNNKLTRSALYLAKHPNFLSCPLCATSLHVQQLNSLVCTNNHSFDISKQGHVNLLTRQTQTKYNKELFDARKHVIAESEFFEPFNQVITEIIDHQVHSDEDVALVDMGSGEGSHLNNICQTLSTQFNQDAIGIGLDISKDGILAAAKNYENLIWLVADLAHTPLHPHMFDVIINILSPSNYEEFNRLLKADGIVIKVVPRPNYLKELRQYFYKESEKEAYSNTKIVDHFNAHFELIDHRIVHYTKELDQSALAALVKMTPLTAEMSESKVREFLNEGISTITVDLDVLVGKKHVINN